jgi:hypothetical protein
MALYQTWTKTKIISKALERLSEGSINTIEDDDKLAITAENEYDLLYPALIATGSWRFAVKVQELSQNITDPIIDEWTESWRLPADYLAMDRLSPNIIYRIFHNDIYTLARPANLYAIYYYQPEEETLPPLFVNYLAYELALVLAPGTISNATLIKDLTTKTEKAFLLAKGVDSRSSPNVRAARSNFIDIRRGDICGSRY